MARNNSDTTQRRNSHKLSEKKLHRRKLRNILLTLLAVVAVIISGTALWNFYQTHFNPGTTINGVDCSWLTAEEACEKLNMELGEKVISFVFTDDILTFSGNSFELEVSYSEVNDFLLTQKHNHKQKKYSISEFVLNTPKLLDTMEELSHFDESNMISPNDAYITLSEDNCLTIVPEVIGNYIDFDEAARLAFKSLRDGQTTIDFASITNSKPQIYSKDLQIIVDSVNDILNTTITFNINDNSSLTLDKFVMKDWIVVDDNGKYSVDIESNLPAFVDLLAEKCSGSSTTFEFQATDFGTVTVPAKNLSLDKEAEIELIKSELGTAESYTHNPIYNLSVGDSYVEIDIARQHVWLYKNGECIVSTDCVTGNKGKHDTREGYFFLSGKEKNRILRGYNDNGTRYASPVDFCMPFDGGIGLHDASWRSSFGGTIYNGNGSHGCVNLPRSAAQTIYENIDYSMPIIVYSSN